MNINNKDYAVGKKRALVSVVIVTFNRKDEVIECIDSVLSSTYLPFEVIVVDNGSEDGTEEALKVKYGDRIKFIRSEKNLFAAGGRNLGAKHAKGDYLLFVDSDNVIDQRMIEFLVAGWAENKNLKRGMAGPFMYYKSNPDYLCWVNVDISLLTSRTIWTGIEEKDSGQYDRTPFIRVGHIPNVFMVDRELFGKVGGFTSDYVMHYEESDLAEKIKRLGCDIVLFPRSKTKHNIPVKREEGDKPFAENQADLLYFSVRNRVLFMKRNSSGIRLFVFLVLFSHLFCFYNFIMLVKNRRLDLSGRVIKGHLDGLFMGSRC